LSAELTKMHSFILYFGDIAYWLASSNNNDFDLIFLYRIFRKYKSNSIFLVMYFYETITFIVNFMV